MSTEHENNSITQFAIPSSIRYQCAQSEINSRIEVRTYINIAHLASVATLATLYFSIKGEPNEIRLLIGALMPLVSTYFAAYYRHNDYIIGCLSAYCIALEKISESISTETQIKLGHTPPLILPTWFGGDTQNGTTWMQAALSARKFSDMTIIGLCAVSPVMVITGGIIALSNGIINTGLNNLPNTAYPEIALFVWCAWWARTNIALILYVGTNRTKFIKDASFDSATGNLKIPELTEPNWILIPRSFFKN